MSDKFSEVHIFGRGKVNLRQLVIFNCQASKAPAGQNAADFIEIARAYRDGNAVNLEDSNVVANYFEPTKSLHLNGIFLTETFGLSLKFKDNAGSFSFEAAKKDKHPLFEARTPDGKEVTILSYAEGAPVA